MVSGLVKLFSRVEFGRQLTRQPRRVRIPLPPKKKKKSNNLDDNPDDKGCRSPGSEPFCQSLLLFGLWFVPKEYYFFALSKSWSWIL